MPADSPCRGDIYHIDFEPPLGPHYAIVVTHDKINSASTSLVVAIITSQNVEEVYPHQLRLPDGTLNKPSKVKCDALITLPKDELTADNWIAKLSKKDMEGLDVGLMKALDLWY